MTLKIAFQMDPLSSLNYAADTTVALILEASWRGYDLYFYNPRHLTWSNDHVRARLFPLRVNETNTPPLDLGEEQSRNLADMDVIWVRQNPPFDLGYITNTFLLDVLSPHTLVLNTPHGLRNAPEKLLITRVSHLMPPTLITEDRDEIIAFREKQGEIVLKPLHEFGGGGVFYLKEDDVNLDVILEVMKKSYPNQPFMIQKFLPAVREGDKRLLMIDGELMGGFKRLPSDESIRSNLVRGGQGQPYELTDNDHKIAKELRPLLKELGLFFVGLDVIGDYLTEINVTSPTGIHMFNKFHNTHLERVIWDKVLEKINARV